VLRAVLVGSLLATMCAPAQAQSYEQLETWCHDDNATDDQTIQGCSAVITSGRESGEKLSRVYYDRGLALLNKNRLAPAIEDFDEAIRLNPNFAEAFDGRGDAYRLGSDPNHAIADYDKAIELKPDYADAFKGRGMVLADTSQYFYAIQDYDQAIKLNPKDAYDRAIALDPNYGDAFNNRGIASLNLGRLDAALADFNNALRIDPKKASALFGRGVAKGRLGDTAGGDADIAAAKALSADVTEGMEAAGVRP